MRTTLKGIPFEYDDVGQGLPVLLIHGFPLDRSLWRPQLEGLKDSARLIAPDLRGFGRSGEAPGVMPMEEYAADLAALLDALELPRAVLCGLSMGGYVALAFLDRTPERVQGLVLCNTRSTADTADGRRARQATARRALDEGMVAIAEEMLPRLLTAATRRDRPELAAAVLTMVSRQRPSGTAAAARGMALRPDRTGLLGSINVPALVIAGGSDPLIPEAESRAMAAAIPGARVVIVPEAGHLSNLESPDLVNGAIRGFLQGI